MCREWPHLPVGRRTDWAPRLSGDIARTPRDLVLLRCSGNTLGLTAFAAAPSDVDDFLTDAGYFLMTLGHQSRYDLF